MKNNKLITALFLGTISAKQMANINMMGAGFADNDFVQVYNDNKQMNSPMMNLQAQ